MSETPPDFDALLAVDVGRISQSHGIKGELRVESLTDFPDRFRRGARLWLDGQPVVVEAARVQGKIVLLKLEGIDDRSAAESMKGKLLQTNELHTIYAAGTYFQHDIVGLQAVTESGEVLGRVTSILETGSNDVYVVHGPRGELLLPAIEDAIKQIDLPNDRIVVEVLEGLDFVKSTRGGQRPRSRRPTPEEKRIQGAQPPKSSVAAEPLDDSAGAAEDPD